MKEELCEICGELFVPRSKATSLPPYSGKVCHYCLEKYATW